MGVGVVLGVLEGSRVLQRIREVEGVGLLDWLPLLPVQGVLAA